MQPVFDVVIVGAGISGALMSDQLAAAGLKVFILEAGANFDNRSTYVNNYYKADYSVRTTPESPYPLYPAAPFPHVVALNDYYVQTGPKSEWFKSTYLRMVGGTTLHWLGTALRLHPDDFNVQTLYGVGKDWPLNYEELEPWYSAAEHTIGVAGNSDIDYGSPRSKGYPMSPIPMSYLSKKVQTACQNLKYKQQPITVVPTPQARNSQAGFQNRPACCGSSSCVPICPIQAKYDALVHLSSANSKGVVLQPESVAYHVNIDANNHVSGIDYLRWDGSKHTAVGKVYILAAHAIEIPKLCLNSRNERFPHGIANSSDQVGRNLMDHPNLLSYALAKEPLYPFRSPLSTAGIESLRSGQFRSERCCFRIQINDDGWAWPTGSPYSVLEDLLQKNLFAEELNQQLQTQINRQVTLTALLEQLPNPEFRVTLADKFDSLGIPRPKLKYGVDEYTRKGMAVAREVLQMIFVGMEAQDIHHSEDDQWVGPGHVMGTMAMGNDPKTSVVDKNLRSHDHPNLFVLGSSVFPTGGCVNPTLTIAALTLRAVQSVIDTVKSV